MRAASLQEKTFEFKNRLANGETLDDILPEAFAWQTVEYKTLLSSVNVEGENNNALS